MKPSSYLGDPIDGNPHVVIHFPWPVGLPSPSPKRSERTGASGQHGYWTWPAVDLPTKSGDFPTKSVSLPGGIWGFPES